MAEGAFATHVNHISARMKKLINSPPSINLRRKSRQQPPRRSMHNRVTLERVLGITTSSSSGLTCDPSTGLVAYPAGCVVVLLHPKKNKQTHILNVSRKTFTALAFSQDGKYLVTGECGHMPCVRVWDVVERTQVAEVQCHKYGVACVAFSTNSSYIVSVGYQHDMTVNVWEWRKGIVIASNKVSSRVTSVSFSEDNSYFVTAGNRHVKFWYLDASKERRVNGTVPLIGRSGLLGEQRNRLFCGVACGQGKMAQSTFCLTSSGLLCQFNNKRLLDSWIDLKTSHASCVSVSEEFVFCGCADGTVRVFCPQTLHYITTLPRPHCLGVDIAQGIEPGHLFAWNPEAVYPDTLAVTYDPVSCWLTCVYSDHSVYIWDVREMKKVGKVNSALYHNSCVWSVETYPELDDSSQACLPPGSFLTCSSDNTIRLWHCDSGSPLPSSGYHRNLYSHDLLKVVYVGNSTQHLQEGPERGEAGAAADIKAGIRVLGISPDGQHLASGDRSGNLRIYSLDFLDELVKVEAHDSEVLCLEYSRPETGMNLLASASRDRLIHILNVEKQYSLEQTLDDHSSSITAVKFTGVHPEVHMVSCGADKSIYFRSAEKTSEGLSFSRSHHVVEKTTLYDMDLDATRNLTAIGCQDRNIRIYNVRSGKLKKCFKGSLSDDGTLLKVQMDPSGMFLATSCSDKNICIFDFYTGECVATVFGHSEIVTGMRFSQDCRHLITVAGDSCVFVWRLDSQMTNSMRKRLSEIRHSGLQQGAPKTSAKPDPIRRQTYIAVPRSTLAQTGEEQEAMEEEGGISEDEQEEESLQTPARDTSQPDFLDPMFLQTNGRLPMWAKRLGAAESSADETVEQPAAEQNPYRPRGRWAEQSDPQAIRTVLATHSLQLPMSPSPQREEGPSQDSPAPDDSNFHPQSLDSLLGMEEEEEEEKEGEGEVAEGQFVGSFQRPGFLQLTDCEDLFPQDLDSPETSDDVLYPANSTALSTATDSDFDVKELCKEGTVRRRGAWGVEGLSPDSACCVGSAGSQAFSQDQHQDDVDSLSQVSSAGSSGVDEEEEEEAGPRPGMTPEQETSLLHHFGMLGDDLSNEKFDTDLRDLKPSTENIFLNPRLSISTRFLSRCLGRTRLGAAFVPRLGASHSRISEEDASSRPPSQAKSTAEVAYKPVSEESCSEKELKPRENPLTVVSCDSQTATLQPSQDKAHPAARRQSLPGQSKEPPALPARPTRQSYMCPTASSRAKMSRCSSMGENLNKTTEEPPKANNPGSSSMADLGRDQEHKENLPPAGNHAAPVNIQPPPLPGNHLARAGLHLDLPLPPAPVPECPLAASQPPPVAPKPRRRSIDAVRPPALVTPTEMRSLGKEGKSYISSIEEILSPMPRSPARLRRSMAGSSPASPQTPARLQNHMLPQARAAPRETVTPAPVGKESENSREQPRPSYPSQPPGGSTQTGPPPAEHAAPKDTGVASEAANLQTCKQIVNELQQCMKKAVCLYGKLRSASDSPEQQLQMRTILSQAFSAVQVELDGVCSPNKSCHPGPRPETSPTPSPSRQLKDERTVALLERYSEMLLRITERKLDCN
ncbi:WD repeat-containing protein 62 isoform X2 [Amia ocellicauda]|uniref:WD repeat-containing protein 62 isoform X2 n=1 Tax=Amia ocellicauda TaxID=2972642 RepID=UPI003463DAB6